MATMSSNQGMLPLSQNELLRYDRQMMLDGFAGITELVPLIGPWLGGTMGVLVTLAIAPGKVIWVALGYLLI